jgi:DnaJ-class molecular chaperone
VAEACRACDGKGESIKRDEDLIIVSRRTCGRCGGNGKEPGPTTGKRRGFGRPKQEVDEKELSLEQQADAFLARKGFNRNGR